MRAAKAAKDVQTAASELTERLCNLVTEEVEAFGSGIGSQLTIETQQSFSEYLNQQAVPLIHQLLRLICCDQPEDPSTAVLMHLAGQACSPSLFSEIKAAFPKVPKPPGKPTDSPRRGAGRARLSINEIVEVKDDSSRAASPVPLAPESTSSIAGDAAPPGGEALKPAFRNPRKKVTSECGSQSFKGMAAPTSEEILEHLRTVERLNDYSAQDLERVADICELRHYEQEEVIISTGTAANELHILLSGTADLCEHHIVRTLRIGEFLGVEAMQQAKTQVLKNPKSLVAGSGVRTLCVPREKFQELDLVVRKSLKREGIKAGKALANGVAAFGSRFKSKDNVPAGHCPVTMLKLVQSYEKTEDDRQMITKALKGNKVLSEVLGLTTEQCETTVDSMHLVEVPHGAEVFKKGDIGNALFIVHAGMLKVDLGSMEVVLRLGDVFGELSLLYDEPRSATIFATRDCRLWVLPRSAFKEMLQETTQHKMKEHTMMLHNVPAVRDAIDLALMSVLAGSVEEIVLYQDEVVCVKGEDAGKLFILQSGFLSVVESDEEEGKKGLLKGDWVGEKQLLENIAATRTVKVTSDKATILMVDTYHFEMAVTASQDPSFIKEARQMTGNAQELGAWLRRRSTAANRHRRSAIRIQSLRDFKIVGALGEGSFGQVLLVTDPEGQDFALKRVSRKHLEQEKQENMVKNERQVMMQLDDSPFIIKLWGSFQDSNAVYFLLQAALGGELFDVYTDQDFWGQADKARFYVACVALGLSHLHSKHVIWRDLKLENCLMDAKGYLKITDFGISKMVTGKTYTVCGTADYFAPETLKQVGHNRAADWWALGIMLFIMIAGYSPFDAPEVTQIYKNIIKGLSKVQFPPVFTPEAEECVRALCRKKPEDRIVMQRGGLSNLSELAFFTYMDWEEVAELKYPAPYIPPQVDYDKIASREMTFTFDLESKELSPWVIEEDAPKPTTPQNSARPSVVDAPAVAAVTGNAVKWQQEDFDDFGLAGM